MVYCNLLAVYGYYSWMVELGLVITSFDVR